MLFAETQKDGSNLNLLGMTETVINGKSKLLKQKIHLSGSGVSLSVTRNLLKRVAV